MSTAPATNTTTVAPNASNRRANNRRWRSSTVNSLESSSRITLTLTFPRWTRGPAEPRPDRSVHQRRTRRWLVVVAPSANFAPGCTGDPQDRTDDDEHQSDDPQDRHRQQQSQQRQDHTQDDHLSSYAALRHLHPVHPRPSTPQNIHRCVDKPS